MSDPQTDAGLVSGFLDSAARHPERPALEVEGETLSYRQLLEHVQSVAATLAACRSDEGPPLTCVLAQRTRSAFVGILGTLASGHGYVPILPSFPTARVAVMLDRSRARTIIADEDGVAHLDALLADAPAPLTVLLPDTPVDDAMRERWSGHKILGPHDLAAAAEWVAPTPSPDAIAYILFTSGSTGRPKGVMVSHANIVRFLDVVVERYELRETDRFSHMFDLTFDLSLFDMFAAWKAGGCLCVPGSRDKLLPARWVVDAGISVWFSVPSTALLMKKTRTLNPDAFPGLRCSLFCGEALPVEVARAWMDAAPASRVENIYGPTELTLACTAYVCGDAMTEEAQADLVPIGEPFPGMEARIVDERLQPVPDGEPGELIMTGPQLTLGYWDDPERTAAAFVVPPGETQTFYRTGDRVRRPADGGPMVFLGRVDHQIKVRGYRVELGEIEAVMRREAGVDAAIAIGWPPANESGSAADGIVGFLDDASVDTKALRESMAVHLPNYMLPREFRVVERWPLNVNGKIDRKALRASLGQSRG